MKRMKHISHYIWIFLLAFSFCVSVDARSVKKRKKRHNIKHSISDAMDRSNKDQDRIRDRMNDEADERISAWQARQDDLIVIKNSGSSSMGESDFGLDSLGEDNSGLDQLRSDVEEESTDINFDEELREVSSEKK